MWVRGLKQKRMAVVNGIMGSHPMWVRGLKLRENCQTLPHSSVAPYVGAWIETVHRKKSRRPRCVAPYVGAWIETSCKVLIYCL